MKICYVISTVNVAGGANRSLLEFLPYIIEAGHECTVLAGGHGSMEDLLLSMGISYKVIPFKNSIRSKNPLRTWMKRIINRCCVGAVKHYLKKENVTLLHNNSLPTAIGMEAALEAGIPYICHIRENIWEGLGMEFYHSECIKKLIRNAAKTISISDYILNAYREFEPQGDYLTLNDGICVEDYYDKRDIFKDPNMVSIGMIGVINPQKGQREAAEAFKILADRGNRDIRLDFIGKDGNWKGSCSYAQELRSYVSDHELDQIRFIPPIEDSKELKAMRSQYDINLVCSKAEGLGRITIESMLSGSLTIAANAGATPEILKNGVHGLLYESGNPEDLSNKILYAIEHKEEMRELARNAQTIALKSFSAKKYADRIMDIYKTEVSKS